MKRKPRNRRNGGAAAVEPPAISEPLPATVDLAFRLNGRDVRVACRPNATLLEVLRVDLALTGTKEGCGEGECGACAVLLDGALVNSCLVMAVQVRGREVVTIEGLARLAGSAMHPLQEAFIETGACQCGFCIPGMLLAAADLLRPEALAAGVPSRDAIRRHLAGNICRCTGYSKIFEAVERAAERMALPHPAARPEGSRPPSPGGRGDPEP